MNKRKVEHLREDGEKSTETPFEDALEAKYTVIGALGSSILGGVGYRIPSVDG